MSVLVKPNVVIGPSSGIERFVVPVEPMSPEEPCAKVYYQRAMMATRVV